MEPLLSEDNKRTQAVYANICWQYESKNDGEPPALAWLYSKHRRFAFLSNIEVVDSFLLNPATSL